MKKRLLHYIAGVSLCLAGCFEIPEEGTIAEHMAFSMQEVPIYLKTQQIIGEGYGLKLTAGETTFPFQLSVEKVTRLAEDGTPQEDATALFSKRIAIKTWKKAFTGEEETREEFEAKREMQEVPILYFSQANDLIFSYGDEYIPLGIYALDIRVTNSSGSKLFKNMLKLNVKEVTPYLLMAGQNVPGADGNRRYTVDLEKRDSERECLTIQIQEKNGEIVPLDSMQFSSETYAFNKKNIFHFTQTHTADQGTEIDLPFPCPYKPSDIVYPHNIIRSGCTLSANRYGDVKEWVQKQDDEGNPVFDPVTGEPVMEERTVNKLRYGFDRLRFLIFEPGDWLMTIKFE